jgi:hypothetical protein
MDIFIHASQSETQSFGLLWCAIDSIIQKNGRWLFTALGQFFSMADTTPLSVKPAKGLLPYEVRIARAALG